MKKSLQQHLLFILMATSSFSVKSYSQVGVGTLTPLPSAALEIKSSAKGFLPPRLSTAQIGSIPSPAAGLMVYDSTTNKPCYFNSKDWVYFDTSYVLPHVGKYWEEGGGVVIKLEGSGVHGLVASPTDQTQNTSFGCYGTNITGAQFTAIGTGQSNTNAILAACGGNALAATICNNLILNDKSDWYLPSIDELALMYQVMFVAYPFTNYYWSSSQVSGTQVWLIDGGTGFAIKISPTSSRSLRAIRSF